MPVEHSVPAAQENRDDSWRTGLASHKQIELAISIKVRSEQRIRGRSSGKNLLLLEGSIAIAKQDGNRIALLVPDSKIEVSVPLEISRD
jgi:hypothetical protein